MTLRKKDVQNYFKRLRKLVPDQSVRYYACGEYGTKNHRPHYHMIVFNVPDSKTFADAWSLDGVQLGSVHVGKVSGDSVAYTMKYIDKSQFVKKHSRDDREPEFPLMSKGLGQNFLTDDMRRYYSDDLGRLHVTREGGRKSAMPRYYRKKLYDDEQMLKQRAIVAAVVSDQHLEEFKHFKTLGYPEHFTFDMWKSEQRYARARSFESRIKHRDI